MAILTSVPSFWQNLCQKRNKNNRAAATVQINATNMSSETTTNEEVVMVNTFLESMSYTERPKLPRSRRSCVVCCVLSTRGTIQYYTVDYVYVPTNLPELPPPFRPTDHRIKSSQLDVHVYVYIYIILSCYTLDRSGPRVIKIVNGL